LAYPTLIPHRFASSPTARSDRTRVAGLIATCVLAGLATGLAVSLANPVILLGVAVAVPVGLWVIGDVDRALFTLLAVIGLMPRFAMPVRLGFTPTFLDLALIALLAAWLLHRIGLQRDSTPRRSAIAIPIAGLVAVAAGTFIVGLPNGALTTLVLRRFVELLLSLLMALVILALLPSLESQERFVRWAIVIGAASACTGIALYAINDGLAVRMLSVLGPFGYPTGPEVLRFVRDDPAELQRATGLWIDPNAFGGYLLVIGALALPQAFARRPVLPRWAVATCLAVIVLALVLTVSRGAMVGLAAVAAVMGVLRYRRALGVLALILAAILVLPQTRDLVAHFVDGFMGRDLATQMRFGEYKDAFRLIERYPLLGVGFVGTPDVDLYIGVSSMYLLVAQQMGLLGLGAFLAVLVVLFAGAVRVWPRIRASDRQCAVFLGAHGAVLGAMFSGIFDHYFFNIDFHNSVMLLWSMIALAAASQLAALRYNPENYDGTRSQVPEKG
jgi:hypothetical protein